MEEGREGREAGRASLAPGKQARHTHKQASKAKAGTYHWSWHSCETWDLAGSKVPCFCGGGGRGEGEGREEVSEWEGRGGREGGKARHAGTHRQAHTRQEGALTVMVVGGVVVAVCMIVGGGREGEDDA